jgi:enoyl-CoA hydratase
MILVQSGSRKYFNVGANLEALREIDKDSIMEWIRRGHEVFNTLEALPVPTMAVVEGYALGGGLELALACDLIATAEDARFGQTEAAMGFVPGWGGSFRLPHRIGLAKAKELFFTGKIITAREAQRIGLADFVGAGEELAEYIKTTREAVCRNSQVSVSMIKRLCHSCMTADHQTMAHEEAIASSICLASGDTQRRLADFFLQRQKKSDK